MRKNTGNSTILLLTILLLAGIVGVSSYMSLRTNKLPQSIPEQSETFGQKNPQGAFSFTAAGDFTGNEHAQKVFARIAADSADFTLALGDLGYVGNGNETLWCNMVKSKLGSNYPVMLVAGNHDDSVTGDGDIRQYAECLPNQMPNTVGDYGVQYYFDYAELARFILVSPDINVYGTDYEKGNAAYTWLANTIQDAKDNSIPWIILGMHKNCFTVGTKQCEIGTDIMNLAVESGVDLILQGHEHGYFRSKQWGLNTECPALIANEYNASCVSDDQTPFTKNQGSVLIISGAGGRSLRNIDLQDSEIDYFSTWSGKNVNPSYGYARVTISQQQLLAEFIASEGVFSDSFTIRSQNN